MTANNVRLLVIGRGPGLSEGTVRTLASSGIHVTGEVARLVHAALLDRPDVLLLADKDALRDVMETRGEDGLPPVVVRSFGEDEATTLRTSGAPGWAIVNPDSTADELAVAILAAARGFAVRPVSPRRVMKARARDRESDLDRLTERERDVLALVSEGLPNKAIAARLGISDHTVKFHLSSIFSKLGVSSRTEAVRRGVRSGLIEF